MQITYDPKEKLFHLYNHQISYVIGILKNGHLGDFYFGKTLTGPLCQAQFRMDQNRGLTNYIETGDFSFSLNLERLVYPCFGTTDYRPPAIDLKDSRGSRVIDFKYDSHTLYAGKKLKNGLPSMRPSKDRAMTLEIICTDAVSQATLKLFFTLFKEEAAIVKSSMLINGGASSIEINRLMSTSMDLIDHDWQWCHLYGDWIKERHVDTFPLHHGTQSIGSLRGASSSAHNPFVMLKRPSTTECAGEALGVALVYSGNFLIEGYVDSDGRTRLMAGIHPQNFAWCLEENQVFESPEALIVYSDAGTGQMSRTFHDVIRTHLIHEKWQNKNRPVLINNWEATYFDFDADKLIALAKASKKLGIELFVLDDGWFGERNDDTCGLGDWFVNTKKIPSGLGKLSEQIHAEGLQFGLWIEPEMINRGTQLYREHPDWLIGDPNRNYSHGRNQYILDFSREEVVDGIFQQLIKVLDDAQVDYIKWDMNRNMTEPFSTALPANRQGELAHRYILGVYALYEKLTDRYPNILFESCSAGGGRFDLGMLYYAPQAWTSDNTDAVERLKIQYGTSMLYPLSSMGSHVSDVPNHQVKRNTSLKMRGDVAYFGTFGYELDVLKMSDTDCEQVIQQIDFFKKYRTLIHSGDFYRLLSPYSNQTAWMVMDKEKSKGLVAWYQVLARSNASYDVLKLQGLQEQALYRITGFDTPVSGAYLMQFGLMIRPSFNGITTTSDATGDYQSRIWEIERFTKETS